MSEPFSWSASEQRYVSTPLRTAVNRRYFTNYGFLASLGVPSVDIHVDRTTSRRNWRRVLHSYVREGLQW